GAPRRHPLLAGVAEPEPTLGVAAGGPGDGDDGPRRDSVLDVERQLETGAAHRVEVLEGRDVRRQRGAGPGADPVAAQPGADDAVVDEYRDPVSGQPCVAFEAGGAQAQG